MARVLRGLSMFGGFERFLAERSSIKGILVTIEAFLPVAESGFVINESYDKVIFPLIGLLSLFPSTDEGVLLHWKTGEYLGDVVLFRDFLIGCSKISYQGIENSQVVPHGEILLDLELEELSHHARLAEGRFGFKNGGQSISHRLGCFT